MPRHNASKMRHCLARRINAATDGVAWTVLVRFNLASKGWRLHRNTGRYWYAPRCCAADDCSQLGGQRDLDRTDTVDGVAVMFPGFRKTGSHPAAGQDNFPLVQCVPEFVQVIGQPAQWFKWMAQHIAPASFVDDSAIALKDAGRICEIRPRRPELAKYVAFVPGVVRHQRKQVQRIVGIAVVDDFECWAHRVNRGGHFVQPVWTAAGPQRGAEPRTAFELDPETAKLRQ